MSPESIWLYLLISAKKEKISEGISKPLLASHFFSKIPSSEVLQQFN